jgi:hypothetical protein
MWSYAAPRSTGGPDGHTYAAVLVGAAGDGTRDRVLAVLRGLRFSGWLGPADAGWVVAVAAHPAGVVATGRRDVLALAAALAHEVGGHVVAVRVLSDRQLVLAVWADGDELGRYVSDPSVGLDDDEVLTDPLGAEHAPAFAAALDRPWAVAPLSELLDEEVDHDSVFESERLTSALRLLGLPDWLVAVPSLPRRVPGGPPPSAFTRLGAGVPGLAGRLVGAATHLVRRRLRVPPVVADPPRGAAPGAEAGLW